MTALAALALAASVAASPKVAVMPVAGGEGVEGRTAEAVTEAVTAQVRRYGGVEVITQKDIQAVLSLEQQKQMLGCRSESCMAELGGALGVDRMVNGDLAKIGESWLFHLKLTDVVKVKVLAQSDRRLRRGKIDDVLDVVPARVVELFPPASASKGTAAAPAPAGPGVGLAGGGAAGAIVPVPVPSLPSGGAALPPAAEKVAFSGGAGASDAAAPVHPPAPLPAPTAPMPPAEAARKVPRPWVEASIPVPLAERRDLAVYTDDRGVYVAVAPFEAGVRRAFAGTKDKLFVQEVVAAGAAGTAAHGFAFWEPRARAPGEAFFEVAAGRGRIVCAGRERPLRALSRGEAEPILMGATFYAPRWRREPHLLAQDDEGNYFYVDRARPGFERGPDYRVYAGTLGRMGRLELDPGVRGGEGAVFVTRWGKLRVGQGEDGAPVVDWLAGGGRRMLRPLDPFRNGPLVYKDLGVYDASRLGTPCDGALE
jgi:TolB-like protein